MTVAASIRESLWRFFAPPEVRDAFNMTQGLFPVGHTAPPKRGTSELLRAYSDLPWLRAVTHKIGRSIGATTWQVFATREKPGGAKPKFYRDRLAQRADAATRAKRIKALQKEQILVEIDGHPAIDVISAGNPVLGGMSAIGLSQIYLDIVGEAFLMKERSGLARPAALWPIPPNWVMELAMPGVRDSFRVSYLSWQADIPATEMLMFMEPDPFNPYTRGSGTARALNDELSTDELAAKYTSAFFKNGGRPDYLVYLEGAGEPEVAAAKGRLEEQHRGVHRAFRPLVTNRKIEVQTLSHKLREMTFVELRKYQRDIVVQVFGMPPEILGIIEQSNRATITAAEFLFSKHVLVPRLELIRTVLQQQLVAEFDDRLILDYVSPVQTDHAFELEAMKAAPWAFDIDEWREIGGQQPLEDDAGKFFMIPFNLFPSPTPSEPPAGGAPGGDFELEGEDDRALEIAARDALLSAAGLGTQNRYRDELREAGVIAKADEDDIARVLDAISPDQMVAATKAAHEDAILAFGQAEMEGAGIDIAFNMTDPRVVHFMEVESGARITGNVTSTTLRDIRATLAAGVEAGEGIGPLSARIEDVFKVAKGARSKVIARTETIRGANFGRLAGMQQAGVKEKEWLATGGTGEGKPGENPPPPVRDTHSSLNGHRVKTGSKFRSTSGAGAMHPGGFGVAAEDINCRCTIIAVSEDDDFDERAADAEWRARVWRSFEGDRQPFERQLLTGIINAFSGQQRAALAALRR